jgi:hypothetical protein
MNGYKVFNPAWTCNGFQYKVGETYKHEGEIALCESGFHFCVKLANCFSYYEFNPDNKVAKIEATGLVLGEDQEKQVTDEICIVRELSWHEVLELANSGTKNSGNRNSGDRNSGNRNSGDRNSGNRNSGDRNSGHRNSGDRNSGNGNSGHRNSGDRNSGNWNSGDGNSGNWNSSTFKSGFFNSQRAKTIEVFNKPCSLYVWECATKPNFIYFNLTEWIPENAMTAEQKTAHPEYKTTGGYLKTLKYKAAWRKAYESATKEDIELLKALPNFDADVFEKISGIRIED